MGHAHGNMLLLASCCVLTGAYRNPVVAVNSPDPGVKQVALGSYVAVVSSGFNIDTDIFPLRTSSDLASWQLRGAVFPEAPAWAAPPFYAPELHTLELSPAAAAPPTYWVVYDATEIKTGVMSVGAAWSASPLGPFSDRGAPLMRGININVGAGAGAASGVGAAGPLRRQHEHAALPPAPPAAASAIDATLWQNRSDSRIFLLFKNKQNGTRHIVLQELSTDWRGKAPDLAPLGRPRIVLSASEDWEAHDVEGPFVWEGPAGTPAEPYIFLFYSGSSTWGTSYAVGVARARSVAGPWEKMGAPLIHTRPGSATTNTTFVSPGHNSIAAVNGTTFLVYHASRWEQTGTNCQRFMMLDKLTWKADGWPMLATHDGAPSDTPQPTPQ